MSNDKPLTRSSKQDIAAFLRQVDQTPVVAEAKGRLVFALDATASRQPSWDQACRLQADMFLETEKLGGLAVQLAWYRGIGEFQSSRWFAKPSALVSYMNDVRCAGGLTQIGKVLNHVVKETKRQRIHALVFVGDCVEEQPDSLYQLAGQLGLLGVPAFIFQEGGEPTAAAIMRHIAKLSHGAYCAFDQGSAQQLRELLRAAAVYAVGGRPALDDLSRRSSGLARRLTQQFD